MSQAIKTFGVREFSRLGSELDRHVEEIKLAGYTILAGVLTDAEVAEASEKVDAIYARQLEEVGGESRAAAINDAHNARCLLAYDDFFLGMAAHARVLAVVEQLLGDYYTLMLQNGIINVPAVGDEHNAGYWHRDLNYQHFVCTRPISVSALFCVNDFSEATGGTLVLPGTHRAEVFPSDEYVRRHETVIEARAGSAVVFDSMLYHRGGHNRTTHTRRAVNHMYTLPFVKQQISLPQALGGRHSEDEFLRRFLGYESEPDESVSEFRRRRLARLGAS